MTNYEWIKSLSEDELVSLLSSSGLSKLKLTFCNGRACPETMRQKMDIFVWCRPCLRGWLNKEHSSEDEK